MQEITPGSLARIHHGVLFIVKPKKANGKWFSADVYFVNFDGSIRYVECVWLTIDNNDVIVPG